MDSQSILYSKGSNDECYTPRYVVKELLPYLPKDKVVWCPFDTEESEFVKVLSEERFQVVNSHISYGQDYYTYEPIERAMSFNKPFALLMSNTWLNDSAPKVLFSEKDLQLLMFRNRIKFLNNGIVNNKITFSSSFYCWNLLPKQIIISDK